MMLFLCIPYVLLYSVYEIKVMMMIMKRKHHAEET